MTSEGVAEALHSWLGPTESGDGVCECTPTSLHLVPMASTCRCIFLGIPLSAGRYGRSHSCPPRIDLPPSSSLPTQNSPPPFCPLTSVSSSLRWPAWTCPGLDTVFLSWNRLLASPIQLPSWCHTCFTTYLQHSGAGAGCTRVHLNSVWIAF